MRGGYQIIDFQKIALTDSNTKVDGVYKAIQDNPLKVLQLNNINLNGTLKDDVFTTATKGTNKYTFDVYDGILTVTSADNVRWVSHDTIQQVISDIDDLQQETSNIKDMISDAYNAETVYTAGQYCIYNDTLYKCIANTTAGTLPTDTTYWSVTAVDDEISALNSDLTRAVTPVEITPVSVSSSLTIDINGCYTIGDLVIINMRCNVSADIPTAVGPSDAVITGLPIPKITSSNYIGVNDQTDGSNIVISGTGTIIPFGGLSAKVHILSATYIKA